MELSGRDTLVSDPISSESAGGSAFCFTLPASTALPIWPFACRFLSSDATFVGTMDSFLATNDVADVR
jgi:hypothetical protein